MPTHNEEEGPQHDPFEVDKQVPWNCKEHEIYHKHSGHQLRTLYCQSKATGITDLSKNLFTGNFRFVDTKKWQQFTHARKFEFKIPTKSTSMRIISQLFCVNEPEIPCNQWTSKIIYHRVYIQQNHLQPCSLTTFLHVIPLLVILPTSWPASAVVIWKNKKESP